MCLKMSYVTIAILMGLHVVQNVGAVTVDAKIREDTDLSEASWQKKN